MDAPPAVGLGACPQLTRFSCKQAARGRVSPPWAVGRSSRASALTARKPLAITEAPRAPQSPRCHFHRVCDLTPDSANTSNIWSLFLGRCADFQLRRHAVCLPYLSPLSRTATRRHRRRQDCGLSLPTSLDTCFPGFKSYICVANSHSYVAFPDVSLELQTLYPTM